MNGWTEGWPDTWKNMTDYTYSEVTRMNQSRGKLPCLQQTRKAADWPQNMYNNNDRPDTHSAKLQFQRSSTHTHTHTVSKIHDSRSVRVIHALFFSQITSLNKTYRQANSWPCSMWLRWGDMLVTKWWYEMPTQGHHTEAQRGFYGPYTWTGHMQTTQQPGEMKRGSTSTLAIS